MDPDQIHHGHRWRRHRDIYILQTTLAQVDFVTGGAASSSPWSGPHPSRVEYHCQSHLVELSACQPRPSEMILSLEGGGSIALSRHKLSARRSHRALVWDLNPGKPIVLHHVTLPFSCRVFLQGSTSPRNPRGETGRRGPGRHLDIVWRRRG